MKELLINDASISIFLADYYKMVSKLLVIIIIIRKQQHLSIAKDFKFRKRMI
jgi:hypothetical protein